MPKQRRYWDSDIFLTVFNKEKSKYEDCLGVLQRFENDELQLVTSAFTLTEVLYIKGGSKVTKEKSEKICRFFEHPNIVVVNVDRYIAEYARTLVWDHSVRPQDAIHLASAVVGKVPILDTFDTKLIGLSGQLGNPALEIVKPNLSYQAELAGEGFEKAESKHRHRKE